MASNYYSVVSPSNSSSFDSASSFVFLTMPSLWWAGEYIVYSFNSSVSEVFKTLCFAHAGTIIPDQSSTRYSLPSIIHFPCPCSKRKNWSFSVCVSIPISSPGFNDIKTSCEYFPVYNTLRKLLFPKVSFSMFVKNHFMILSFMK